MPREKKGYRDNLELITAFIEEKYGDNRHILTNSDIQNFTGLSYEYVKNHYMQGERYISIAIFARELCPNGN